MIASNLHALLARHVLLLGSSVKSAAVRFHIPSSIPFKEASWVRVRLASYFNHPPPTHPQ
jgi:hypothetical protein